MTLRKLIAGAGLAVCAFFAPCDSVAQGKDIADASPPIVATATASVDDPLDDLGIGGAAALEGGMLATAIVVLWRMHVSATKRDHDRADKATTDLVEALKDQAKVARDADTANRAGLAELKAELGAVRTEIGRVREAMGEEIRKVREDMDSRFETVHKDIRELTDRVEDLEGPMSSAPPSQSQISPRPSRKR